MIIGEINKKEVMVGVANHYTEDVEYVMVDGVKEYFIDDGVLRLTDGNGSTMAIFNMVNVVSVY